MTEQKNTRLIGSTDWLLLRNILCIAAGVLMWMFPDTFSHIIVTTIGIVLVIYGILAFSLSLRKSASNAFTHTATINSIVSFIAGMAFIMASAFFAQWFFAVTGGIIVLLSLLQLVEINALRKYKRSTSALFYLSPIILLAVGIVIIFKPEGIIHLVDYLCAGSLIYTGCSGILLAIKLHQFSRSTHS